MRRWRVLGFPPKPALVVSVLLVALISGGPAHGLLRPYGYIGTVLEKDPDTMTMTIQMEYSPGPEGWQPDSTVLEGVVPNDDAMNEIDMGDEVIATSLGSPGGVWIALGKIAAKRIALGKIGSKTEKMIAQIYGDPDYLWEIPLLGDYVITYDNRPDCSACSSNTCEAMYTTVTITDGSGYSDTYELNPGERYTLEAEDYPMDITFISGQAPSCPLCTDPPCIGPQALSSFVIHIGDETQGDDDGSCFIGTCTSAFGW